MYAHGIRHLLSFPGYVVDKITVDFGIAQVALWRDRRFRVVSPNTLWTYRRRLPPGCKDFPRGV